MKTEIYFELVSAIGAEATDKLCLHYGGTELYVPSTQSVERHKANKAIIEEARNGADIKELASKYGRSVTGIRKLIKRVHKA